MEFTPTKPPRRPERIHNNEIRHDINAYNPEGIRTFYKSNTKS